MDDTGRVMEIDSPSSLSELLSEKKSSLIEQLGKAISDLEAQKNISEDKVQWTEIEDYFRNLEGMLKKKSEELESKKKHFEERESNTRSMLQEKEADVAAKEQALLDRVQGLKDAAVAAITESREKHKPNYPELVDGGDTKDSKVSSSIGDTNAFVNASEEKSKSKSESESKSPRRTEENAAVEINPRPELTHFCQQMDAKGLLSFTTENKKRLSTISDELAVALESAADPARLVLNALEGFYPSDETVQSGGALQGTRQSCVVFMKSMAALLAKAGHLLNPEIKQQAKAIADEWKPKLAGGETGSDNVSYLEAQAFLQLLATFKIASEFDEEELCKFVLAVAGNRQAPQLCRSLELTHKMPGVVEVLITSGKRIEAVHFIQAFQLSESFPLAPLLEAHLKDFRRGSEGKEGNLDGGSGNKQNDGSTQELAALKAVIKCVEEYRLESEYPLEPLRKRVAELERKPKAEKKRPGESVRRQHHHHPKKARANGGGSYGFRPRGGGGAAGRQAPPAYGGRAPYYSGMSGAYTYEYQAPPLAQSALVPQAGDQRPYYYPPQIDKAAPAHYNAAAAAAPTNYNAYISGAYQSSSHQPFM